MFHARARAEAVALVCLVAGMAMATEPNPSLDATVFTTTGASLQLKSLWGRPTVLFYEDRHSTAANQVLKDELFARGKAEGLLERVGVVAVANVKGYDWFPARNFVVSAVKDTEKAFGIPVYLDWSGALSAPPWKLPEARASVVVLDRAGSKVLQLDGGLSPQQRAQVFSALETELQR